MSVPASRAATSSGSCDTTFAISQGVFPFLYETVLLSAPSNSRSVSQTTRGDDYKQKHSLCDEVTRRDLLWTVRSEAPLDFWICKIHHPPIATSLNLMIITSIITNAGLVFLFLQPSSVRCYYPPITAYSPDRITRWANRYCWRRFMTLGFVPHFMETELVSTRRIFPALFCIIAVKRLITWDT